MATFDPIDRVQHDVATALEIAGLQHLLAVLLEAGRPADGEDVLPHRPPDPVLRVPQRKESRLEAERFALVVEAVLACQVVKGELDVVQVLAEVRLVRPAHRLARAGLVIDDLNLAVADVVDAVDLADDVGSVELKMEAPLQRQRPQSADRLHPRDEADVVAEQRAHLLLLAPAVERPFHAREVAVEVLLQHRLQEILQAVGLQMPPLLLVDVKILEHLVQESAALHRHGPRLLGQAGVVVVPVQARALQVVVEGRGAEVVDLHVVWIALSAVRLERLARFAIGDEGHVETQGRRPR